MSDHITLFASQTDGHTDGRTTCLGNTAPRVASRGKNWRTVERQLHRLIIS